MLEAPRAVCNLVWVLLLFPAGCFTGQHFSAEIQSPNPDNRIMAIRQAAESKDAKAVPLLVDRLEDEDSGVRFFAILALERITGERFGYDYAKSAEQRASAVTKWREYVRQLRHADLQGRPRAVQKSGKPEIATEVRGPSSAQSSNTQ